MSDALEKAVNQVMRNELAMRIRQWIQGNKHMMPKGMVSRYEMKIGDEDGEIWKIQVKVWRVADEYKYLREKKDEEHRDIGSGD